MNITIDTEVLQSKGISLGEFLVLLMSFNDISYTKCLDSLVSKGIVQPDVFNPLSAVLSNNTKDFIPFLLMLSDSNVQNSHIDFLILAHKLQSIYPAHKKPGTTYDWRGKAFDIAQKLMTLVAKYSFTFTEEEAIASILTTLQESLLPRCLLLPTTWSLMSLSATLSLSLPLADTSTTIILFSESLLLRIAQKTVGRPMSFYMSLFMPSLCMPSLTIPSLTSCLNLCRISAAASALYSMS